MLPIRVNRAVNKRGETVASKPRKQFIAPQPDLNLLIIVTTQKHAGVDLLMQ